MVEKLFFRTLFRIILGYSEKLPGPQIALKKPIFMPWGARSNDQHFLTHTVKGVRPALEMLSDDPESISSNFVTKNLPILPV